MFRCAYTYSRLCVSPTIMDADLQALFWCLLKKRTRNSRLTARAILQRSSSEKMYRIRRKTRLTVLLLTALVSHFTVERSFWQIPRTSAWFDLTYSTYSDDQWYASFRVSKNTFLFPLLTRMWRTLNYWRWTPRAQKKRNRTVPFSTISLLFHFCLLERGYPAIILRKYFTEVKFSDRKTALWQRKKCARTKILPFVTQHPPALRSLKRILMGK